MSGTREWDAGTYDRVSEPQLAWGRAVLDRLGPAGDELVLDAGCGTGRVTELLIDALPDGSVIGVDGSREMIDAARGRLGPAVRLIHSDLLELQLPDPVDAVFSSATFHWIRDHRRLFMNIATWLRPGGRLEAQCGGEGNVAGFFAIVDRVAAREPYATSLANMAPSRHFAGPGETAALLEGAGFVDVRCWLEPSQTRPPDPRAYIEGVCLGAHTTALPESARESFVADVYEEWAADPVLDYVRLNISARRRSAD
ncbi:MAG: methyltransferase domain-containing protein [Thermoleophilia bacterium]|nr:methyltransferase domain-containing protein [Thermoleophilia bacterium]